MSQLQARPIPGTRHLPLWPAAPTASPSSTAPGPCPCSGATLWAAPARAQSPREVGKTESDTLLPASAWALEAEATQQGGNITPVKQAEAEPGERLAQEKLTSPLLSWRGGWPQNDPTRVLEVSRPGQSPRGPWISARCLPPLPTYSFLSILHPQPQSRFQANNSEASGVLRGHEVKSPWPLGPAVGSLDSAVLPAFHSAQRSDHVTPCPD